MKLTYDDFTITPMLSSVPPIGVWGETDRLTDVVLCAPNHLQPVPCCSVTRESLRNGFNTSTESALKQHKDLRKLLVRHGVRYHSMPEAEGLPDLCFARDIAVTTPWGISVLNPALPHRSQEADHLMAFASRWGTSAVTRITKGTIEGGDICIARSGLLIVGVSGERTTNDGAEAFAAPFRAAGWKVALCSFDPRHLHLDTIFCMLNPSLALACIDALDPVFIEQMTDEGIRLLPVTEAEARKLGCNILSLDGHKVIAGSGTPRVSEMMREAGFEVYEIDIGQFTACGGGVHCLTMPLRRVQPDASATRFSQARDMVKLTPIERYRQKEMSC